MSKTTKARLVASDATNPGVHLTHLIKKMMTTKISTYELKLIHDGGKRDLALEEEEGGADEEEGLEAGVASVEVNSI